MIELSILIATMPCRTEQYRSLMQSIVDQNDESLVEVITDISLTCNIGAKRNSLLRAASGDYIVFIDDDDQISPDYISKILKAIESNPDCIGISGTITTNGTDERQWYISKDYGSWFESAGNYYRTTNHISPVKRELALKAGFPEIEHGEDYEYAMRLLPLLQTEVKIEGNIYFYKFISNK